MDPLTWRDRDGDTFTIETTSGYEVSGPVALVHAWDGQNWGAVQGVYVDEADAHALIDWLQKCVREFSSTRIDV